MQPNADMCAVSSADQFMVIKRWDRTDKGVMLYPPTLGAQPERQFVNPSVAFDTHSLVLRQRSARRIETMEEVVKVLSSDVEVISRTHYFCELGEVLLEYPVKTVNFSERHRYYQVDTGPVLFVGEPSGPALIEHLHLAYVAHLGGSWAEFLISRPTQLEGTSVSVHHYSEVRHVEANNSLWAVDPA